MVAMATATIAIVSVVGRPRRITSTIDHNAPSVPRPVDAIAHFTIPRKCSLLVMMDAQTTPQTSPVIADTTCWATGRWLCSMFHQCCAGDAKRGNAHRNVAAVSVPEGRDHTEDPRNGNLEKSDPSPGRETGVPVREHIKVPSACASGSDQMRRRRKRGEQVALPLTPPISCCALDRRGVRDGPSPAALRASTFPLPPGGERCEGADHSPSSLAAASW
jgi:hypothetical protein